MRGVRNPLVGSHPNRPFQGAICAPNYNKVGQLPSPLAATADGSLSYFLEHIAYPQREQIGRLLTSNLT